MAPELGVMSNMLVINAVNRHDVSHEMLNNENNLFFSIIIPKFVVAFWQECNCAFCDDL